MLTVYPLGVIEAPSVFCDVGDAECNHVCCVISIPELDDPEEIELVKGKGEIIIWDDDGFPDIYLNDKLITFESIKRGIKMLEKDSKNKFKYKLIRKNALDI